MNFHYLFWFGTKNYFELNKVRLQIKEQILENLLEDNKNKKLAIEIEYLKEKNSISVENNAREKLNMIKKNEIFYMII